MSRAVLVLRPEPGAAATASRAVSLGLAAVVAPLFTADALAWSPPDAAVYDAVMMTSANAARLGGAGLRDFVHLPAYAVGEATAAAMRDAGFADVVVGPRDVDALAELIAAGPHRRLFHPCGRHLRAPDAPPALAIDPTLAIDHLPVYRAAAVGTLPAAARDALRHGAVPLLHSPRAASLLAALVDDARLERAAITLVAISAAAAAAAGSGWRAVATAAAPTDAGVLACARALCDKPPR